MPIAGIVLSVFCLMGCSDSGPTSPDLAVTQDTLAQPAGEEGNHYCVGEYIIRIRDTAYSNGYPTEVDIEVIPLRTSLYHFDVTQFDFWANCADCIKIGLVDVTPEGTGAVLEINVWLKNPLVSPPVTAYDVRGIIYPPPGKAELLGAKVNDEWTTPEGLTELYNDGKPEAVNAYLAFNQNAPFRPFSGGTTHARTYFIWKDNSYKLLDMAYAVDVSFPGNAEEAVKCDFWDPFNPEVTYIYPNGSDEWIYADITDWQDNVSIVTLDLAGAGFPGIPAPVEMDLYKNFPDQHMSRWRYHLTEAAGTPAGTRDIRLMARDAETDVVFMRDHRVEVTWDPHGPKWKNEGQEGIYDHIADPHFLYLFFYEAWDVSPYSYKFFGSDVPGALNGDALYVIGGNDYVGYARFGEVAAPANQLRYYGLEISDLPNPDLLLTWEEYACTRHNWESRWSFIKDQPPSGPFGIYGGPAIGDVTGDDGGIHDIVIGCRNHRVYLFRGNGTGTQDTIVWEYKTGGSVHGTPALADLGEQDGILDVIVASDDSVVYCLEGGVNGGTPIWTYDAGEDIMMHSSPSIAQMNGTGPPDVIIGTGDGRLLVLDGFNGFELWSYPTGSGIAGTAGVADVNGDTVPDICFGSYANKVYMLDGATHDLMWEYGFVSGFNNIDCSPAMVCVDEDELPDVVIGGWDVAGQGKGIVVALTGDGDEGQGEEIWINQALYGNVRRTPAPVDLDNDGTTDYFIVTCYWGENFTIYALNAPNGAILFHSITGALEGNEDKVVNCSDPIVGDFTGDGHLNALFGMGSLDSLAVDGYVDLYNIDGFDLPGEDWVCKHLYSAQVSKVSEGREFNGCPAVGDVDGDGELELVVANMRGYTYILDMNAAVPEETNMFGWTQFMGNRWHTGVPGFVPPDE